MLMLPPFSELLKQYIQASGVTVYQLAKISGVNRTSIQKAIKGERLPQIESVKVLASKLNLTAAECETLMEAYEMECCGRNLYIQRKYVKYLIESMALFYDRAKMAVCVRQSVEVQLIRPKRKVFTGEYTIGCLLETFLKREAYGREHRGICLSITFAHGFYDRFMSLIGEMDFRELEIRQIIDFVKTPVSMERDNQNLRVLTKIVPYLLIRGEGYRVYQRYVNILEDDGCRIGFPNSILFSDYVFLLSADFKTVYLEENMEIVKFYRDSFEHQAEQAVNLFKHSVDVIAMGEHFMRCDEAGNSLFWIEEQPCFIPMCREELVRKVLMEGLPYREQAVELVDKRSRQFYDIKNKIGLFTEEGLAEFASTGVLKDIPVGYARPFTSEERLCLLENLYEEVAGGEGEVLRMINTRLFPISRHISVSVHSMKELSLYLFDEDEARYHCIEIEEYTLVHAFYDFIKYAAQSKYVCSKMDTLSAIQFYIEKLKIEVQK